MDEVVRPDIIPEANVFQLSVYRCQRRLEIQVTRVLVFDETLAVMHCGGVNQICFVYNKGRSVHRYPNLLLLVFVYHKTVQSNTRQHHRDRDRVLQHRVSGVLLLL